MFKEGKTYKVKLELSPGSSGYGRATVISRDQRTLCISLKNSKGASLKVPNGCKIWFVSGASDNRFNGVWCSQVEASRNIGGVQTIICSIPKFEKQEQRRHTVRLEWSAPASLLGYEWQSLKAKFHARNISRLGIGFSTATDCASIFLAGSLLKWLIKLDDSDLQVTVRVVNSRFNWLLNRTELGAEFVDLSDEAFAQLEVILRKIESQTESRKQLAESGSLARWVKADKENLGFVKLRQEGASSDFDDETVEDEYDDEFDELEEDEEKEDKQV